MGGSSYFQLLNPMVLGMFAVAFHLLGKYDRRGVARLLCLSYAVAAVGFTSDFFVRDALGPFLGSYVSNVPFVAACLLLCAAMHARYGVTFPTVIACIVAGGTVATMTGFMIFTGSEAARALTINGGVGLLFFLSLNAFRGRTLARIDRILVALFAISGLQFIARPLGIWAFNGLAEPGLNYTDTFYALALHFSAAVVAISIAMTLLFALGTELVGRLSDAVRTDPMTALLNRRGLEEASDEIIAAHGQAVSLASVIMTDIDHFKSVNDRFGHAAGDVVIRAFAQILEGTAREHDLVARVGGEEFVVVLPETRPEVAQLYAEGVRTAFGELRLQAAKGETITASFGIAEWRPETRLDKAIDVADAALYEAKNAGRNCVRIAPVDPDAEFRQPASRTRPQMA